MDATPPPIWQASAELWAHHNSQDLVYRLDLAFSSAAERDRVWRVLGQSRPVSEGAVLCGGAALTCLGARGMQVISGGEDALDSLDDAVNDALATALDTAGITNRPTVTGVDRRLVP
ncbi:hypothetical protein [Corynebacterium atypicum]|uniref:hypothetical protein n=1 Tax=Corynebacterium atypicum TaxID=191610 RepID=UPI000690AEFB|nr:hypothetical protein [Corynebacterium atypicum]